ncbi:hypothetical protein BB561_002824, partial [Smittium simulii]
LSVTDTDSDSNKYKQKSHSNKEHAIMGISYSKRMKVDYITDNHYSRMLKKKLKANQGSLIPRQILDAPASISNVKLFRLKPEPIQNMGIEIKALEKTNSKNYLLYNQNTLEDLPKTFAIVLVAGEDHSIDYKVLKQLNIAPAELSNPHYIQPVRGPIIALNHKARLEIKIEENFAIGDNFFAIQISLLEEESELGSDSYDSDNLKSSNLVLYSVTKANLLSPSEAPSNTMNNQRL